MSFKGKLTLNGNVTSYNVLNFEYEISQRTDRNGIPRDRVMGHMIELTIESSGRNTDITQWAMENESKKSGTITFSRRDAEAGDKELRFTDAFCVYHKDVFDANSATPMKTILRLSAKEANYNDGAFSITRPTLESIGESALKFAKKAAATALNAGLGVASTTVKNVIDGKSGNDIEKDAGKGLSDGVKDIGKDGISSFIPD